MQLDVAIENNQIWYLGAMSNAESKRKIELRKQKRLRQEVEEARIRDFIESQGGECTKDRLLEFGLRNQLCRLNEKSYSGKRCWARDWIDKKYPIYHVRLVLNNMIDQVVESHENEGENKCVDSGVLHDDPNDHVTDSTAKTAEEFAIEPVFDRGLSCDVSLPCENAKDNVDSAGCVGIIMDWNSDESEDDGHGPRSDRMQFDHGTSTVRMFMESDGDSDDGVHFVKVKTNEPLVKAPPNFDRSPAIGYNEYDYDKCKDVWTEIKECEVRCLEPEQWLNDLVMSYYIRRHIQPKASKRTFVFGCSLFVVMQNAFNVSQGKKTIEENKELWKKTCAFTRTFPWHLYDHIIFPVHMEYHWSLAVVENPLGKDNCDTIIGHVDSIQDMHKSEEVAKRIMAYLRLEALQKYGSEHQHNSQIMKVTTRPNQENGYDCGLYVLHYAERFAEITGEARFTMKRSLQSRSGGFDSDGAIDLRQFIQTQLAGEHLEESPGSISDSSESETKKKEKERLIGREERHVKVE